MHLFYRTITAVLLLVLAPLTHGNDVPSMGVEPTVELVTSYDAATDSYSLRSVLWSSPLTGEPISYCGFNTNPNGDVCFFYFWCSRYGGIVGSSAPIMISGYRLTDTDLHDMLLALSGQKLEIYTPESCVKGNTSNSYLRLMVQYRNTDGRTASAMVNKSATNDNIPANMSCSVIDKSATIDYGMVPPEDVDGQQASIGLQLTCLLGNGYAKVYAPGYDGNTGLPLRADGSLFAMLDIDGVSLAHPTSLRINADTTVSLPVNSTLRSSGEVADGPFSGSLVINVEFY